jgi:hypothetical protein
MRAADAVADALADGLWDGDALAGDVAEAVGVAFALGGSNVHPEASKNSAATTTARCDFTLTA